MPLKNNEYILDEMKQAKDRPDQNKAVLKEGVVVLSDYGKAFCKACVTIQLIVMVRVVIQHFLKTIVVQFVFEVIG